MEKCIVNGRKNVNVGKERFVKGENERIINSGKERIINGG